MPRPAPAAPCARRAFTLIELLVVISIIALLISILLPALGSARFAARSVRCATQLSQIGRAQFAYAADFDGFVTKQERRIATANAPAVSWDDHLGEGGYDGRARGALGDVNFLPVSGPGLDPIDAPSVYQCPLDDVTHGFAADDPRAARTYSMPRLDDNTNNARGLVRPLNPARDLGQQGGSRRLGNVLRSSATIMVAEALDFQGGGFSPNRLGDFNEFTGLLFGPQHDPRTGNPSRHVFHHRPDRERPALGEVDDDFVPNYLYADGHVEGQNTGLTYQNGGGGFVNNTPFDVRDTEWDSFAR